MVYLLIIILSISQVVRSIELTPYETYLPKFQTEKIDCDLESKSTYYNNTAALSAISRVKNEECKTTFNNIACFYKNVFSNTNFYDSIQLKSSCSNMNSAQLKCRLKVGKLISQIEQYKIVHSPIYKANNIDVKICNDFCVTYHGYKYFGFIEEPTHQCVCIKDLPEHLKEDEAYKESKNICNTKKKKDTIEIYSTSYVKIDQPIKMYIPSKNRIESLKRFADLKESKQFKRIVFVFTVFKRTYRQLIRTFKSIYDESHAYYFHIDSVRSVIKKVEF